MVKRLQALASVVGHEELLSGGKYSRLSGQFPLQLFIGFQLKFKQTFSLGQQRGKHQFLEGENISSICIKENTHTDIVYL